MKKQYEFLGENATLAEYISVINKDLIFQVDNLNEPKFGLDLIKSLIEVVKLFIMRNKLFVQLHEHECQYRLTDFGANRQTDIINTCKYYILNKISPCITFIKGVK